MPYKISRKDRITYNYMRRRYKFLTKQFIPLYNPENPALSFSILQEVVMAYRIKVTKERIKAAEHGKRQPK